MTISGAARLAGVMGWPVEHSLSPRLHNFWLSRAGIDGAYVPLAVAPDRFEAALRGLAALGFAGCNVTVPHKETAFRAVDHTDDFAGRVGAVNTIVVGSGGSLQGSNTDGFGFLENLRAVRPAWSAATGPAVIIGAGGAARAIVAALADDGAPEIRLVNRTQERAEALANDLQVKAAIVAWDDRADALDGAALLVNTTTLGMDGQPPLDLAIDALPSGALVNDIVYKPLMTPLLAAAAARGNPVADGLGMLLHQARPGFAAWFGCEASVDAETRAHVEAGLAGTAT